MKKLIAVVFAIVLVASFGTIAMATTVPGGGIDATYHDMSSKGASAGFGDTANHADLNRICVYCHAPHNTNRADGGPNTYRPLWNHGASQNTAFTMYANSITGDMPGDISHQSQAMAQGNLMPGSVSLLCLSCHDGTTAVNSYGYASNTAPGKGSLPFNSVSARANIGGATGDLSNHHPIGFNYAAAQGFDSELAVDTSAGYLTDATLGTKNGGPVTIGALMWNGNMECTSCHDVHNTQNGGVKFTWVQDRQSALCLTCHLKASATFVP